MGEWPVHEIGDVREAEVALHIEWRILVRLWRAELLAIYGIVAVTAMFHGKSPPEPKVVASPNRYGKEFPVRTDWVTTPPKANMAKRPLASSFIWSSLSFAGSEPKPIGSKP